MTCVNHKPFIIRIINQNFQQFLPDAFSPPPDESLMDRPPSSVIWWQITPRGSGSQYPKNRVNEAPVILGNSSPLPPLSWQMRLQQRPYFVAYIMPMIGSFHFLLLYFLLVASIISHLSISCRRYLRDGIKRGIFKYMKKQKLIYLIYCYLYYCLI